MNKKVLIEWHGKAIAQSQCSSDVCVSWLELLCVMGACVSTKHAVDETASTQQKEKLLEVVQEAAASAERLKTEVGHETWSGRVRVPEAYLELGTAIADTAKRAITVTQV